ncbi:hypothetical protein [Streptomyces sp. NPDC050848]|uniref:hypothetical protein n=1 Tax=Streptomyces sp. NPDC050848 TaxID=3155791 RepID=UPI0033D31E91
MTHAPAPALAAVTRFVESLTAASTRRQRNTFLQEYLAWIASIHGGSTSAVSTRDLLAEENAAGWLRAAERGSTRRRPGLHGPQSPASRNSMAARVSTLNAFSAFYGRPLGLQPPPAQFADPLSPAEAHRVLDALSRHQPAGMLQATWERSVAVIAVAMASGQGMSALHSMRLDDVDLEHRPLPRVRVRGRWHPIVDASVRRALERWSRTHQALTAGHLKALQGGDVQQLWVTTAPGRPRGGVAAPPAGLPAAVRTLEAAHRKLTATALGSPLLLEQFCIPENPQDTVAGP